MNAPTRLATFAVLLAGVFGAGAAIGGAVGPDRDDAPAPAHGQPESNENGEQHERR